MVAVTATALVGVAAIPAQAALPTGPTSTGLTGSRPSATNLKFPIDDRVSAQVDVATGNLLVSTAALSLTGVNNSVPIGQVYNSRGYQTGSTSTQAANGWSLNLDGAGSLVTSGGNPVYIGPDGSTWPFTAGTVSGTTTTYGSPAGLAKSLTYNSATTNYRLTDLTSRLLTVLDTNGNPSYVQDKNNNRVTTTFTSGIPTSVATTAGPSDARTATLNYVASYYQWNITQTNGSHTRTVTYTKNSSSDLTSFKDATGKTTTFGYTAGKMTSIVSPTGAETDFTYNSAGKLSQIDRLNTTAGSPGTSTTRLSYASTTQTLVAGPNTDTSVAVATGAHTTYTLDATKNLVLKATDPMQRERSKTYNANALPLTSTSGVSGASGSTQTSAAYEANGNQSLTSVTSPGGSSSSATYSNASAATAYLPQTTTSDTGSGSSSSTLHYTAFGQQDSSTTTADDGTSVVANLTYNTSGSITDGTVATATAPGNTNNPTTYGYNTDHQLTSITPVTGSSLQAKAFTYDWFGRLATETDGAGNTTSYTYDNNDRLLTTSFSDSTPTVTDTYDAGGHLLTEASGPGTVTNTYDQLGRLTSTVNTAGGGTISYGFDKASNETSMTTSYGTWTNTFDASGVLLVTKYPKGSSFQYTDYATDSQGRRTDTFLQANATYTNSTTSTVTLPTSYAARYTTTYANGRIGEVKATTNGSTPATTFDTQYCYNSAFTTSCSTATASDHSKVYWSRDLTSGGSLTVYKYTSDGRVKSATETGGTSNTVWAYTYDNRGNRLTAKATVDGGTPTTQTLTYNAANQISTTGYVYDGAGNLTATPTATYTYNAAEQMTSSTKTSTGVTTSYTYAGAAQNTVLSESTPGDHTYNLTYGQKDSNGQPEIVKYNTHTAQNDLTGNLFADPTTGQPAMLTTSSDIGCLYVYDGLDNPVGLLTDFAANAISTNYDPYGVGDLTGTGNGVGQNPYTFHSGTQDRASGLIKFGIRWYNPTTGTWTQQDTLDAPFDPVNANRYVFVGGDPVNSIDPNGHEGFALAGVICDGSGVGLGAAGFLAEAAAVAGVATAAGCLEYDIYELQQSMPSTRDLYATHPEELVATAGGY